MAEYINPLRSYSNKKAKEFNEGVEQKGIEFLIEMNEKNNAFIKEHKLKSKDYKKFIEEQADGNKDSGTK